jgi:hypothetical protein
MNVISRFTLVSVATFGLAAGLAFGNSFDLSYQFNGPACTQDFLVTATFDGTQNGNLVTDISDVTLALNGLSVGANYVVASLAGPVTGAPFTGPAGNAVISIDGTQNDFSFVDVSGNGFKTIDFQSYSLDSYIQVTDSYYPQFSGTSFSRDPMINDSWTLKDPPSAPVPERGTTASLLGLSLLGLACFHHRLVRGQRIGVWLASILRTRA